MKTKLLHVWDVVTSSYWFIPMVMAILACGLAAGMLIVDQNYGGLTSNWEVLYAGGPDGARTVLGTVAASIITVAGVVFSITIAALTQAAQQFGPRLLRNFMRDVGNQVVLGTFVATFIYCLLVLRSIHGADSTGGFVPHASVTVAVALALASIAVLIYFIHHISQSLQAPVIVAAVAADLQESASAFFPSGIGRDGPVPDPSNVLALDASRMERDGRPVPASENGYLQAVAQSGVMRLACDHDLVLRLNCRPGDYVVEGNPLLYALPADRCNDRVADQLQRLFITGRHRTAEQDVEYAINQLVEVAARALSPAINDPFTAETCIDYLGAALSRIAQQKLPSPWRYDDSGNLRVLTRVSTFSGLADGAFNRIRQYSREHVSVRIRMLEVIAGTAHHLCADEQRQALCRHVEMIYSESREMTPQQEDRRDIEERYRAAIEAIGPFRPLGAN